MITLRQAYEEWAAIPSHRSLYHATRDIFKKLFPLLKMNILCNECTLDVVAEAFCRLDYVKADKVSPASVLVHVLAYAHEKDPKGCPAPDFTYEEVVDYEDREKDAEEIRKALYPERQAEAPRRVRHPVVQIDPKTLKPIRTFESVTQVQKELGIKNLRRAIGKHSTAGGFYWCEAGAEFCFVPKERLMPLKVDKAALAAAPEAPEVPSYMSVTDGVNKFKVGDHVWSRLKEHAGMTGTVVDVYFENPKAYGVNFGGVMWKIFETDMDLVQDDCFASRIPPKISEPEHGNAPAAPDLPEIALANFSNEEILEEIRRRGWEGSVSFMVSVKI